ncbi:uncharacterized protein LOC111895413 [Lactuca sativa]|uniref:uncharacterized protein LOC111895413 n=1 Tax=Lactuca sativa TaxID=4236 RepID=UPI000CAD722A|nr:uncharacterized protein LOC111895413 [Lactuca sativa]
MTRTNREMVQFFFFALVRSTDFAVVFGPKSFQRKTMVFVRLTGINVSTDFAVVFGPKSFQRKTVVFVRLTRLLESDISTFSKQLMRNSQPVSQHQHLQLLLLSVT